MKEKLTNIIIFLGVIILDRILKIFVSDACIGSLCIKRTINQGAAFGIFSGMTPLFIIVAAFVLVLIVFFYSKVDKKTKLALTFIAAGTIGNLIDRIFYGGVIDFLKIWKSSAFNIADLSNTIGAIILIYVIFSDGQFKKQ